MSYFSAALSNAIREAGIAQTDLCEATGIGAPAMSKYVRGALIAGSSVATKIIERLPFPQNAHVLAGFLRDQTPERMADLVEILPRTGASEHPPDPIPSRLIVAGRERELLAYFARRIHDPVIFEMLDVTRRALEAD